MRTRIMAVALLLAACGAESDQQSPPSPAPAEAVSVSPSPSPVPDAEACALALEALRFFDGQAVLDGLNEAIRAADTNDLKQFLAAGADLIRTAGAGLGQSAFKYAQKTVREDLIETYCPRG